MEEKRKLISIVTPVFNEEDNIQECYETIRRIFQEKLPQYDREHIFCDNASTDRSLEMLRAIAAQDPSVRVIANSRNFGPFHNTFNGIINTRGDAVLMFLAADLQDPPELIPDFVQKWESGYEVVYGVRKEREEGWLMKSIRRRYYNMVTRFADFYIPPNAGEFSVVDRKVVEALRKFDDYYPYIRGMVASCGFRCTSIEYTWRARKRGMTKNRLYNLLDQGLNGMISFTKMPLRLAMFAGFGLSLLSILWAIVNFIINLILYRQLAPPGIATLIVAIFFFSGVQLFLLGLLGEYIGAIHFQVRKRPLVIERERINF